MVDLCFVEVGLVDLYLVEVGLVDLRLVDLLGLVDLRLEVGLEVDFRFEMDLNLLLLDFFRGDFRFVGFIYLFDRK